MAELTVRYGDRVNCNLHRGDRGVFDVLADGNKIFSKDDVGRFPQLGEVAEALDEILP